MWNGSRSQWKKVFLVSACVLCAAIALWSFLSGGLFGVLLSADLTPDEKLSRLRDFFNSFGHAAPIAYVIVVTTEVVIAPIPGTMLYAPGGVVFGGFWGGLLSLVGNVAGAAISCQLMRVLGDSVRNRLIEKQAMADLQARIARHGILVVFLLRVNPLTSSDLVSYAAGLTAHARLETLRRNRFGNGTALLASGVHRRPTVVRIPPFALPVAGPLWNLCVHCAVRDLAFSQRACKGGRSRARSPQLKHRRIVDPFARRVHIRGRGGGYNATFPQEVRVESYAEP